jgi:hypothetical protein
MAKFLKNSGDILLDAVLTDYGRQLLARGDGSFNIVKFALGDDEIDYSLYGSVSKATTEIDKEILNTPVLEAFTNNAASMKSKLITVKKDNLLFLPILKVNNSLKQSGSFGTNGTTVYSGYVVPVESNESTIDTQNALTGSTRNSVIDGVIYGQFGINIDQGLDSNKLSNTYSLKNDPMLYETEYNISIDSRFGVITSNTSDMSPQTPISIDDDMMATYRFTDGNTSFVKQIAADTEKIKVILGHQGTRLNFNIKPASNLMFSNYLFEEYGQVLKLNSSQTSANFRTIRTSVEITGVTTGYTIEIPVMFAKKVS